MFKKSLIATSLLFAGLAQAQVLTTIKPLGFIASAISENVTQTEVLLPTSASPHDYSLKPSDVEKLNQAELIVWVGDEMETFLEKSLEKLPEQKILRLEKVKGIEAIVEQAAHESEGEDHDHEHAEDDGHHHDHNHDHDWHIWLSPQMGEMIATEIATKLSELRPEQKAQIEQNLVKFKANLTAKNEQIRSQLANLKQGYYTFHDAYGYFERTFGLNSLGSFTINPSIAPGAKTLQKIKQNISANQAKCLFTEPQFTPKVVESLSKNTQAQVGSLDPLGANIALSPTAYPEFLQQLADSFSSCLAK